VKIETKLGQIRFRPEKQLVFVVEYLKETKLFLEGDETFFLRTKPLYFG
jgi:hypothetical protein